MSPLEKPLAEHRLEMLVNRVKKNSRKLKSWRSREAVTCYRLYDRDIPEIPLAVDWYDGRLHVSVYTSRGEQPGETELDGLVFGLAAELGVPPERISVVMGDTDTVPNWIGGGAGTPNTDLPYACMDGGDDWYPDLAVGRFPVRNLDQLAAIDQGEPDTVTLYRVDNDSLNPGETEAVTRLVMQIRESGMTIMVVEHIVQVIRAVQLDLDIAARDAAGLDFDFEILLLSNR